MARPEPLFERKEEPGLFRWKYIMGREKRTKTPIPTTSAVSADLLDIFFVVVVASEAVSSMSNRCGTGGGEGGGSSWRARLCLFDEHDPARGTEKRHSIGNRDQFVGVRFEQMPKLEHLPCFMVKSPEAGSR